MSAPDPWRVLGVSRDASPAEIRAAYRKRAAETHPDRAPDKVDTFLLVQAAYRLLSDPSQAGRLALDPSGTLAVEHAHEKRRAQMKRRRARVSKLYE